MNIKLQTNLIATQLIQNVEDLFASIAAHYQIPHVDRRVDSGVCINFGAHPIKSNRILYTPYQGQQAEFYIGKVNDSLLKKVLGLTARELGLQSDELRKAQGNDAANSFPSTFQSKLDSYFGAGIVSMNINTYNNPSVSMKININTLSLEVISAVSDILMHSELAPSAGKPRIYAL